MTLEVVARDGAARLAKAPAGERELHSPAIFWVESELDSAQADWQPRLNRTPTPTATLVNTFSITAPRPQAAGALVLERRLWPAPSMQQGKPTLEALGEQMAVFLGAAGLFRNPQRFVPAVVHARTEATHGRLLYAPGLGEPNHLALLAYSGVDLFDGVPLSLAAAEGRFLTESGSYEARLLAEPMCSCPACDGAPPAGLDEARLRRHNQHAARAELGAVRNAIRAGRLRELVEARARSHPELTGLLRRLDAQVAYFEERAPLVRATPLHASSKEALQRPECVRYRSRVETRWAPPPEPPILLLLPCSRRKPYSLSRTHRSIREAVEAAGARHRVHEVVLTSPLGLVPRELELVYPAAHYDVPVTGQWDEEEGAMIRHLLRSLLSRRSYAAIVAHLPRRTFDLVQAMMPVHTRHTVPGEDATAPAALAELQRTLRELAPTVPPVPRPQLLGGLAAALAAYQFDPSVAARLLAGTRVAGRWPMVKVYADDLQLASLPPERGLLSLTLEGGRRLLETGKYAVEIDDFPVKGSVFAVGVQDADPQIRVGDEVVVHHRGDLRGVGVAAMAGPEMVQLERGEAVRVRHHA